MSAGLLLCALFIFWADLWCGLYLLSRNPNNPRLLLASSGLFAYGLAVGCHVVSNFIAPSLAAPIALMRWGLLLFSVACLIGTIVHFMHNKDISAYLVSVSKRVTRSLPVPLTLFALGLCLLLFVPLNPSSPFYSWTLLLIGLDLFFIGVEQLPPGNTYLREDGLAVEQ